MCRVKFDHVKVCSVVMFRMLVGRAPFAGSAVELYGQHLTEAPPVPSWVAPQNIPEAVDALVLRALSKRPAARFSDARAMRAEVERVLARLDAPAPDRAVQSVQPQPAPSPTEQETTTAHGTRFGAVPAGTGISAVDVAAIGPAANAPTMRLPDYRSPFPGPRTFMRLPRPTRQQEGEERSRNGRASEEPEAAATGRSFTQAWWPILAALAASALLLLAAWAFVAFEPGGAP